MQVRTPASNHASPSSAATIIGCSLLFSCALARAQIPTSSEVDAAEQRRALERETQLREQQERVPDVRLPRLGAAALERLPEAESPCFTIDQLQLQGNESTRFDWLRDALAGPQGDDPPLGRCLGLQGIRLLLRRAQDRLVARGYITTRILAQPQDLSSGILRLTLLPGRIGAIRMIEPQDPRATIWNAVPAKPGDILNLRDIEQALENFKRVPTAEADIRIAPADQPDHSDLLINYRQGNPLRLSLAVDDSGTKGTGKYQGSVTLSYDNWWNLNDLFYIALSRDLGGGDPGPRGTGGATIHYSIPFGYWALGATLSESRYDQTVAGLSQDYVYSGTSGNAELKLSRLVYRDASRKTTTSLKAFERHSRNYIDDTEVQIQRRVVGGWEIGIGHKEFLRAATLEVGLAFKRGTGDFGTLPAPEEALGEGTSRFCLLLADASLHWMSQLAGRMWRYSASWRAQYHGTPLTPQDRFAIGGRHTVRGFDGEASLSAESGWLVRNEASTALGASGPSLYFGLDHGEVSGPSSDLLVGTRLTGAVIGLRGSLHKLHYDLFWGTPLDKPESFRTASNVAGFSVNWML